MTATSQQIIAAAEEIEHHTSHAKAAGIPDPKQLCETYNKIKGPLKLLLGVIALLPVYGSAVATGLQTLMGIADQLCPAAQN
jgi:hypothetical protein